MGQQRFTPEFKDEAVRQVTERGYKVVEVAARLGVSSHSLYKWVRAARPSKAEVRSDDLVETKKEVLRLRSELRRVEEERDILKKAAVDSIGECNIIKLLPTEGDVVNGPDGTTGTFRFSEGGHVEAMETGRIAQ